MANCRPDHFLPYIQPYEFEALLFSDVAALARLNPGWASAIPHLREARAGAESPEHINDGAQTKPAARLEQHLKNPHYRKALDGPLAAQNIGLAKMEAECRFFAAWLARLHSLGTPPRLP